MKATAAAAVLLAGLTAVSALIVDVRVPAAPQYGDRVELVCDYRLESGDVIQEMTWRKDGRVFMTYSQTPREEYSFKSIAGININETDSTPRRIILNDVQDSASGTYGVQMTVTSNRGGSSNVNSFSQEQEMTVGGAADTLGNRFGGSSAQRPAGGSSTVTTSFSSSSSSSSGSTGPIGDTLGNRFGGNRPSAAAPAAPAAASGAAAAAEGLANAQQNLQNAFTELQNALNNLGR